MTEKYETILKAQLNHRTIREFKDQPIPEELFNQLLEVARRTPTSTGLQSCSVIRITDKNIKAQLSKICRQDYVARAPELLVFVVDQHRNSQILKEMGRDSSKSGDMDKFFQSFTDACLMAQNVNNAVEALGLGAVYLGSILNNPGETIKLLDLPEYTFPVVGMGIGYPDQEPQLKPRMAMKLRVFENKYNSFEGDYLERLSDYDEEMTSYYDLRDENRRSDSFTRQVEQRMTQGIPERQALMNDIVSQGFDLKLKK